MIIINLKINIHTLVGDDSIFLKEFTDEFNRNYYNYFVHRYYTWSSRSIIEFSLLLMVQHPFRWKLINSVAMTIICIVPAFYYQKTNKFLSIIISSCLFLLIPIKFFNETGWIATTTNYLWVASAALLSLIPIFRYIQNKRINPFIYVISLLALVYASDHEQMVVLLLVFLSIILLQLILTKRKIGFILPYILICISKLIFILTCPGNKVRNIAEIKHWFPDYINYNFFQKLFLGYCSTLKALFFEYNPFMLMLFLLLAAISLISSTTLLRKLYGLVPLIYYVASIKFNNWNNQFFDLSSSTIKVPLVILMSFVLLIHLSGFYFVSHSKKDALIILLLLLSGIGVRMIMGFSPTIWASGIRTYLFTYILFILLAVYINTLVDFKKINLKQALIYVIYLSLLLFASGTAIINTLSSI